MPEPAIKAAVDQSLKFMSSDEFVYLRVRCRTCGRQYAPEISKVLINDSKIDIVKELINHFHKHDKDRGFECVERFEGQVEGLQDA